jgi:hypothetical protein
MSVYSYIEVIQQPNAESQKDKNLLIGFGHGIHWSYQIAVARGERTYRGVYGDMGGECVHEQELLISLENYQTAIQACLEAVELGIPEQANWLHHDLERLFIAQDWYQKAWLKLPDGIVKLDWCEVAQSMSWEDLEDWNLPNDNFAVFVQLGKDCTKVLLEELSTEEFIKKYQKYSGKHCGVNKMETEL